MNRQEVVYRLGGVDPDDGVNVYEIVPILSQFSDLVEETARQFGYEDEISVRVRPFKKGSFITEFVLQSQQNIVSLFNSPEINALLNILQFLGFCGVGVTIPKIVSKVHGKIDEFIENDDGTFTYGDGDDAVTITEAEQRVMQSPKIADLYGEIAVAPIARFNGNVDQVSIYARDENVPDGGESSGAIFTRENAADFATYSKSADLIDQLELSEVSSITHGVVLIPVSGPYDGAERGYTFTDGDNTYKSVKIEDEEFRKKLESTEFRFAKGDVIRCDIETKCRKTKSGRTSISYAILHVIKYEPYIIPEQEKLPEE